MREIPSFTRIGQPQSKITSAAFFCLPHVQVGII